MQGGQEERTGPEEKAKEGTSRSPGFEKIAGGESVPDPSGDQEIGQEDRDNPLVNDSSFEDESDQR